MEKSRRGNERFLERETRKEKNCQGKTTGQGKLTQSHPRQTNEKKRQPKKHPEKEVEK